ncbi:hypothetical protein GCM10010319_66390 [Streptomyces blastmyceticus]|uniref:Uncharacterized protein n=1 Tax=Streptomyces blastmyceticus TaxID=68180 RepID=A0ABN0Y003_9ACTN
MNPRQAKAAAQRMWSCKHVEPGCPSTSTGPKARHVMHAEDRYGLRPTSLSTPPLPKKRDDVSEKPEPLPDDEIDRIATAHETRPR